MAHQTLDSVVIRELIVKQIRNDTEIIMSSNSGTTDGWTWKNNLGQTVARIDSSGNLHLIGAVLTDL